MKYKMLPWFIKYPLMERIWGINQGIKINDSLNDIRYIFIVFPNYYAQLMMKY